MKRTRKGKEIKQRKQRNHRKLYYYITFLLNVLNDLISNITNDFRPPTVKTDIKKDEGKKEEEEVEEISNTKKEPLSLEELLAKKKAEEAAKSKVELYHIFIKLFYASFEENCFSSMQLSQSVFYWVLP